MCPTYKQQNMNTLKYKSFWFILAVAILCVFWNPINLFISKVFVPTVSLVSDSSWISQIGFLIPVVIGYIILFNKAKPYSAHPINRWCVICTIGLLYFPFRMWGNFRFYGILANLSYVDVSLILAVVLEIWISVHIIYLKRKTKTDNYDVKKFEAEIPAIHDDFDRKRYAELLVNKIIQSQKKHTTDTHAFTILLNERYGVGKTTFINFVRSLAIEKRVIPMDFKPWLCDSPSSIITSFFRNLASTLGDSDDYISSLLDAYSKMITDNTTSRIAGYLSSLQCRKSIEYQYKRISERLTKCNTPILVFVDDVDRLLKDEIMAVLKLIRNTADFPNLYYLVAADKSAICEVIKSECTTSNPNTYIKKFFNFELMFPSCEKSIQQDLMSFLPELFGNRFRSEIETYLGKLKYLDAGFSNHRDVVRFYNQIAFSIDSMRAEGVDIENEIMVTDFIGISILQYVDSDLYKLLRDHDEYFLVYYGAERRLSLKNEYRELVSDRFFARQMTAIAIDKCKTPEDIKQKKQEYDESLPENINEAVSDATPSRIDLVCSILSDLFYDRINYQDKRSIRYVKNYFLYFAQKFRKNEIPKSMAIGLLDLDDDEFRLEIETLISKGTEDSIRLGFSLFADRNDCAPLQALKNILTWLDLLYSKSNKKDSLGEFSRNNGIESIITIMYLKKRTEVPVIAFEETEKQIEDFIKTDSRIGLLAAALLSLHKEVNYSFVFEKDKIDEWCKILAERYISEIQKQQEEPAKIDLGPYRDIYILYPKFSEMFFSVVKQTKDKDYWIFNMVKPLKGSEAFNWNSSFMKSLNVSPIKLSWFAQRILNDNTSPLIADLEELEPMRDLSSILVADHPFLKAAKEWRDGKGGRRDILTQ